MIGLEDRQNLSHDIALARTTCARLHPACEVVGIHARTLQRWQADADRALRIGDQRPHAVRPPVPHALSEEERARILAAANEPRFASLPPARIVPMLADEGVYLAYAPFWFALKIHPTSTTAFSPVLAKRQSLCRREGA